MKLLRGLLFVVGLALFFAPKIGSAFQLSPAVIETTIQPGQSFERTIAVKNPENQAIDLFLTIQKFVADGNDGRQRFLDPTDTQGLPEWVRVSAPRVHLEAGAVTSVRLQVLVPITATPGTHHAALFFTEQTSAEATIKQGMRIGSLLFITVPGGEGPRPVLRSFIVQRGSWNMPKNIHLEMNNLGTEDAVLIGSVSLRPTIGLGSQAISLSDRRIHILPNAVRVADVPVNVPWWWLGWHSLTLKIDGLSERQITFFAWGGFILLLPLLGLGLLSVIVRRHSKKDR